MSDKAQAGAALYASGLLLGFMLGVAFGAVWVAVADWLVLCR